MRRHVALIFTGISAFAYAQVGTENADSMACVLDPVSVTAQASRQATSSAPMKVIDSERIIRTGVTDVSDALHRLPGVNLRDYGGAGGLKTVSVRGFGAGHTGVSYDGVPLSDVQSGQIDLSRYSVDNVSSLTMVIGDNDDIFIPARLAASSASVNISTISVDKSTFLTTKIRIGSFGLINPYLSTAVKAGSRSHIGFTGEYTHADNDYPFTLVNGTLVTREKRKNSRMNSGHGELNWSYTRKHTDFTSKLYYYRNSRQLPGPVIFYNDVSNEKLDEENVMVQTRSRTTLSKDFALATIAKFNFASSLYHDENGSYPGGVYDRNYWQREYYASTSLLWSPTRYFIADYSADYIFNNLNSNLSTDRYPYRHSILQSLTGKYRTSTLTVTVRILASVYLNGARYGESARNHSRLSPSASISWQPIRSQLLYLRASYKNIFRMPTFNEAYFEHYGSTDVKPENTDQLNIGMTYTGKSRGILSLATISVDGYVNNIRDMIVGVPYNMFIWRIINLGKVRTYGLDTSAEITISPFKKHSFSLNLGYALQRAMPMTDPNSSDWKKQVAYIPRSSGSATLTWENPWVNMCVTASGVSDRYTTNDNLPATRIDGYVEVNASMWMTLISGKHSFDVRADILNLFDKQYCVVARYPMPGRSFRMTFTYKI